MLRDQQRSATQQDRGGRRLRSVAEQSGIKAGDGGFQVEVRGHTELKGAVIGSTQAAIDTGRNVLQTATLTTAISEQGRIQRHSISVGVATAATERNKSGINGASAGVGYESGRKPAHEVRDQ